MAKSNRRQSRELRLLQEDSCFEESMNVRRSEFKCEECSLSFHRKTSYDSHVTVNHKKKAEMAEIWKQLDKPDRGSVKLKPNKPTDNIQIVNSNVKHKIVVGLDGKVVKKYKTGIVELRKKVNETNVANMIRSGNVRLVGASTSGQKPTHIAAKSTWNNPPVTFDNKNGIQCLNCKHYYKNSFEFGVHTTRVEHRVPCQICFQSFENQCYLKRHQRVAHPHVCNMCDKLFSTQQNLDVHRKVSHRMIFQAMKTDNKRQNTGASKSNPLATIVISDSDSDETKNSTPTSSHNAREASGSNVFAKKHKLSAKDMMQNLASIAQSKDSKDTFSNMLSVMLEKPPIKRATSMIYTTTKPTMAMQMSQMSSVKKPVQQVQNKVVALNPSLGTTTGLSSFLGQHVTSTVYSNLRPKGSFNLGKQVERVNLACRLAQHKQSLELKRLLKRHPQYKVSDRDLKFKIPLGNLNAEFDDCPLFPREEDIKVRTSDYTLSPLSVIDDTEYLESFGLTSSVMQRMFSEAVDSCVLQEAWKLTHSTILRKRSREVTSYSLKQKQECILELHVQLLAIRNAAQTIVNKAVVKHITGLRQAGKQIGPTTQVGNNQASDVKGQGNQNEPTIPKTKSDDGSTPGQNSKSGKSDGDEKQLDEKAKTNKQLQSDSARTEDGCNESSGPNTESSQSTPNQLSASIEDVNHSLTDNATDSKINVSEPTGTIKDNTNLEANSGTNGINDPMKQQEEVIMDDSSCEKGAGDNDVNGTSVVLPEKASNQGNTKSLNESSDTLMTGVENDVTKCSEHVEEISGEKVVENKDDGVISMEDESTGSNNQKQAVKETVDNGKISENEIAEAPCEKVDNQDKSEMIESKQIPVGVSTDENKDVKSSEQAQLEDKMEVNTKDVSCEKDVENSGVFKSLCNKDDVVLIEEKSGKIEEQSVKETVNNKNKISDEETPMVPPEKVDNQDDFESEQLDKLQALTDELMKAIPTTKSGETIFISEVEISSEYCGLIGKGHYNGMDFRWIVQFARPYVNTLLMHRKQELTNGDGGLDRDEKVPKTTNINEASTEPASSSMTIVQDVNSDTTGTIVSQSNISSQASTFAGNNTTLVSNAEAQVVNVATTPVVTQMAALPSLSGFPWNAVQPLAAAPVALPQPATPALLQMLHVDPQPSLTTFTSIPAVKTISTNILLNQGLHQVPVQNSAMVNLANMSTLSRNSSVCVPTGIVGSRTSDGSQIASIPHLLNIGQKDILRPILPKSLLALTDKNLAILHQEVLRQSAAYTQPQLYSVAATKPVANNSDFVPTNRDSNQLPSEARMNATMNLYNAEEPKEKFFYTYDDCLEFEAGEIVLFNNDIQAGRIPTWHQKKLFKCRVGLDSEMNTDNLQFLNSLYYIKKIYITAHLSKKIYQKLIPLAQILTCSSIPLHIKRTYTFLVETLLKKVHHSTDEDVDKIHNSLLDVLSKSSKKSPNNSKSGKDKSKTGAASVIAPRHAESNEAAKVNTEVKDCGLQICLTDIKLPRNQSTVLVTEKKNAKNEHIGFVIKNKTGAAFKKDLLTNNDYTKKRSRTENRPGETGAVKDANGSKVKSDKATERTKSKQANGDNNDSRLSKLRKQPIKSTEGRPTAMPVNSECDKRDSFLPDETDPEIEFATPSPKKRRKSGQKM